MKKKGKVIQIIPNKEIDYYLFSGDLRRQMIETGKDLIVLLNPEYPKGIKGYLLSFKKDKPEDVFPILMNSKGIKEGDELKIECKTFTIKTEFYIKEELS